MSITTERGGAMTMKNPPHPGVVVLQECIEPLGLSITDAAGALGVTRNTLSELVNGKRGISPEMAVRLAKVWLVEPMSKPPFPVSVRFDVAGSMFVALADAVA